MTHLTEVEFPGRAGRAWRPRMPFGVVAWPANFAMSVDVGMARPHDLRMTVEVSQSHVMAPSSRPVVAPPTRFCRRLHGGILHHEEVQLAG